MENVVNWYVNINVNACKFNEAIQKQQSQAIFESASRLFGETDVG